MTSIWDSLNKEGGIHSAGIHVVDLDGKLHLLEYLNDTFSPIGNDYFLKNPHMLDRTNWFYRGKNGNTKPMDVQHEETRKAYDRVFFQVMKPFAPYLPKDAGGFYGNNQQWGNAMLQLVKLQKEIEKKNKAQTQNPNSAVNKVATTIGVEPKPQDIGSNSQVPVEEKPLSKELRNKVEHSALQNIQNFLEQINPYIYRVRMITTG